MSKNAFQAIVAAPGFSLGLRCNDDDITEIEFLEPCAAQAPKIPLAKEAVRQLRAYLKDPSFEFALPLAPAGTPFQRKVWRRIAAIPAGHTRSYGEIATAVKSAPRAVGGACGANPYPVVVPCHRVLAAGGALGGFARERGGFLLEVKRRIKTMQLKPAKLRDDIVSALHTTARAVLPQELKKPSKEQIDAALARISVNARHLMPLLNRRVGARLGYSRAGWRNIPCLVKKGLKLTGAWSLFKQEHIPLTGDWLIVAENSDHVSSPSSSMMAVWWGKRLAAAATPDGRPGPHLTS